MNFLKGPTARLAAAGLVLILLFWVTLKISNGAPGDGTVKADFEISSGMGASSVIAALYRENLIRSPFFFKVSLYLSGKSGKLKRGVYTLNDGMAAAEIIRIITTGSTKTVRVTIPEGYNNRQIGDLLAEKKLVKSRQEFLSAAENPVLLKEFGIPGKTAEGYLYPETYEIPLGYKPEKIVKLFLELFRKKTATVADFPADPVKRHDLIILSSIVEREAKLKEERALIAGVFANRMADKYPLESCATIQYLFDKPKPRIFYQDLKIPSPYNTYIHAGLPPGPIANPGLPAIEASLRPQKTDYRFFVVKGDGSHHFSKSFNEHAKAKNQYIPRK